jgi:Cu(I)/Ag(I) efflux system membrane fusion protein
MNTTGKVLLSIALGATLLTVGAGAGLWWAQHHPSGPDAPSTAAARGDADRKVLYWYDPMRPDVRFDKPGRSPFMDMELVPRYADGGAAPAGVRIDPRVTQNLGVRLVTVSRTTLASVVDATGVIGFNEREVAIEQTRVAGFVERVWPLAPGDVVAAGQPLAELLVPEWTAAHLEFLALRGRAPELADAARERMRLLGMPATLIRAVERSGKPQARFTISASRAGVIQSLEVRQGMTLTAGQTLARINGLDTVWLEVAVPETQMEHIGVGSAAQVGLAAFPDRPIAGRVTAILPQLSNATRTLRVRVELPNPNDTLRPGMSAQVRLRSESDASVLVVPTEAVIYTGKRTLVIVAASDHSFVPVEITLGGELGANTVIGAGLEENQRVVASGQFLIDSEASLSGVLTRLADAAPASGAAPLHEAEATVQAIEGLEITLAHGPFRTLGMPGMTMRFPLANAQLARGITPGDRVRVAARETDQGLVIERIEKPGGQQGGRP